MGQRIIEKIRQEKNGRLRLIITVLFAACVLYIWYNSMQNAAASSARSEELTRIINEIISIISQDAGFVIKELFVRKFAHFAEYALLGVLTVLLFWVHEWKPFKRFPAVLLTGLFVAALDESIQLFSVGRSAALLDVGIDMFGFLCSMLFSFLFYLFYRYFDVYYYK